MIADNGGFVTNRRQMVARVTTVVCAGVFAAVFAATSVAQDYAGIWSGTWDGAGTGGFELTLEKGTDGALGGKVSVTGEPTYKATLKTVKFDGAKMTATYDFPPDERAEVALSATFEGNTGKGTWTVRSKDGGGEVASGGWTVKRGK
jgi:hypothetical protein